MIVNKREKKGKGDKRTTVPDFLLKESSSDAGIYIEVTEGSVENGHKNRQLKVITEAGLASRYVQLTERELKKIKGDGVNLLSYIKTKIANRD